MDNFNILLKQAIEKSGHTIYSLSKLIEYDRSTLNNQINGKRKMSKEVFSKIITEINLTEKTKQQLIELFNKYSFGSDYQFIENIQTAILEYKKLLGSTKSENWCEQKYPATPILDPKHIKGERDILKALNFIIKEEIENTEPTMLFNIDPRSKDIFSVFNSSYSSLDNKDSVKIIVSFSIDLQNEISNFNKFIQLLPLILHSGLCPYYCFIDSNITSQINELFPYYFITSDKLLLISEKTEHGILITDKSIVNAYTEEFENNLKKCNQFKCDKELLINIPALFKKCIKSSEQPCIYGINKNLCTLPFLPKETLVDMVGEYAVHYESTIDELLSCYPKLHDYYAYCTIDSLIDFANTGIEACLNSDYISPLSIPQRIDALEKTKEFIINGGNFYLIEDEISYLTDLTYVMLSDSIMLLFSPESDNDKDSVYVIKTYNGALKVLIKFLKILNKNYYCLTKSNAIAEIDKAIAHAKNLFTNES